MHRQRGWHAGCLLSVVAGIAAFLFSAAAGLAAVFGIIMLIPPDVPNATEAYECFGDAIRAIYLLFIGGLFVIFGSAFVGCKVALRVAGLYAVNRSHGALDQSQHLIARAPARGKQV
jgi:hypothetical protein